MEEGHWRQTSSATMSQGEVAGPSSPRADTREEAAASSCAQMGEVTIARDTLKSFEFSDGAPGR